jgi:hypothetical protein
LYYPREFRIINPGISRRLDLAKMACVGRMEEESLSLFRSRDRAEFRQSSDFFCSMVRH